MAANYWELDTLLGKRARRKIGNNTYAVRRSAIAIDVVFHTTPIITHTLDGATVYRSGGHRTRTTKDRLNRWGAPHLSVYQSRRVWYVTDAEYATCERFYDGMRVR
jgi:hypothetical protein